MEKLKELLDAMAARFQNHDDAILSLQERVTELKEQADLALHKAERAENSIDKHILRVPWG